MEIKISALLWMESSGYTTSVSELISLANSSQNETRLSTQVQAVLAKHRLPCGSCPVQSQRAQQKGLSEKGFPLGTKGPKLEYIAPFKVTKQMDVLYSLVCSKREYENQYRESRFLLVLYMM